ncbi:MAG: LacI family DNA-binding transcriptional regulator [Bacteroidota bacterium]
MANMKDIAEKTGLSLATISRAFNNVDKVSPKTRNLVLKAAKELNFRPNKMASSLRSGKSQTIGIVVPVIDRQVFSASIRRMEEVLRDAGYNIIICQTHESYVKELDVLENLQQLKVDGVIISVSKETQEGKHLQKLADSGTSVVLFDRTVELHDINSVVINNFQGAYLATQHLMEQGCRHIIHLGGNETVSIFKDRRRGFEAALKENGDNLHTGVTIPFDDGKPDGIEAFQDMLLAVDRPDGILAHGDISALVAMGIIRKMKLRIPNDIAIVGFGESTFCPYVEPSLSSINQCNEDVGKLAAEIMLKELQEKQKENLVYTQQVLQPKLMPRASSLRKT